jgi:branched-chain amino acid transport system substrate-binding protein
MRRSVAILACVPGLVLFLAVSLFGGVAARAASPVEIPVVLPLTGGAAFLGQGERHALQILEKVVNETGGIGGAPVRFTFHDDQTSPAVAVQLTSQIKTANPPVIIGSALVAMCNAMAPLTQGGPVLYCLSPGIHPAAGTRVFSSFISTSDLARALLRYYRGRGFTRLALITSTDASGQDGKRSFEAALKLPENASLHIVASVQFNTTDVSVAAQVQEMKAAHPQAVIAWTSGSPMGTVLKGIAEGGLNVPVATTDANMTYAQMKQYASFLPSEMLLMSSEWPPHSAGVTLDPKVLAAQKLMFDAYAAAGIAPDVTVALAWDPAMLVVDAMRKLGRGASPEQIRAYLAAVKGWAGINGIYDFTARPQRGLDVGDAVVTRWLPDKKSWTIVSKPGGAPL